MKRKRYDRYWGYPEVTAQLPAGADHTELLRLIEAGDTDPIEYRLLGAKQDVRRLVLQGITPEEDRVCHVLFDEVLLATRSYGDVIGSVEYLLSRRVGRRFLHRVYLDADGSVAHEFETDAPLTRRQVKEVFDKSPWLEGGFEDGMAESELRTVWNKGGGL